MLQRLSFFSYDACVLGDFMSVVEKKDAFLVVLLFKVGSFLHEEFMIENILFLHFLCDFDVTKNILKHKTSKS